MSDLEQHAVTPAEWNLLMRLDDALPKGTPDHRLVIEAGMALVLARHESIATYLASEAAERALAVALDRVFPQPPWIGVPISDSAAAILAAMRAEASE